MTKDEALKIAGYDLDGVIADVEKFDGFDDVCLRTIKRVRSVIDEALEQPAQESVYAIVYDGHIQYDLNTGLLEIYNSKEEAEDNTFIGAEIKAIDIYPHLAEQSQEPVAWMAKNEDCTDCIVWEKDEEHTIPLYTHPNQWQGLTDDEIDKCGKGLSENWVIDFARAIEQALKEKNT